MAARSRLRRRAQPGARVGPLRLRHRRHPGIRRRRPIPRTIRTSTCGRLRWHDPDVAAAAGQQPGRSFHLVLNNVRPKDNRILPRGFTQRRPTRRSTDIPSARPRGRPALGRRRLPGRSERGARGGDAVLPDDDATTSSSARPEHDHRRRQHPVRPVGRPRAVGAGRDGADLRRDSARSWCRAARRTSRLQARPTDHYKEWSRCYQRRALGLSCDTTTRDQRIAAADSKLRERLGGPRDAACSGKNLTPATLDIRRCPAPCSQITLFDMSDLCELRDLPGERARRRRVALGGTARDRRPACLCRRWRSRARSRSTTRRAATPRRPRRR